MFQFHFGSIGSALAPVLLEHEVRFNSTLVRLEVTFRMELAYLNPVSIPLWFDWKKVFVLKVNAVKVVSIPLWFDWKLSCKPTASSRSLFQFHFGSIGSQ